MITKDLAVEIRKKSLEIVHKARASHIASAMSMVDILAVLYNEVMNIKPNQPDFSERDYFILSKGHACVGLYATLGLKGFYDIEDLDEYGENDSIFMNHISHKVPGVEFSTGSLGHGLSFGVGIAKALKLKKKQSRVFVLLGDGELAEGSNWEALLFANHHKLNNLVIIVDCNNFQSLTTISETLELEPIKGKLESFGCNVCEVDGHNFNELRDSLKLDKYVSEKPKAVLARTIKGKGISFMEHNIEWHYTPPNDVQLQTALTELKNA